MINTRMTSQEILKEYWNDYYNFLRSRCFKVVERNSKELTKLQKFKFGKSDPPESWWYISKKLRSYKSPSGNQYRIILGMKLIKRLEVSAIKTIVYTEFLDSTRGSKTVILFPAEDTSKNLIIISAKFLREYREQEGVDYQEATDTFIKKAAGKFTVYSFLETNPEGPLNLEIDFEELGIGLGKVENKGGYLEYRFLHYLGEDLTEKMHEKFKDILDPIKLWEAYHAPKEIKVDIVDWEEQERLEKQKILDEIFDKYEND